MDLIKSFFAEWGWVEEINFDVAVISLCIICNVARKMCAKQRLEKIDLLIS